jgi:hypothetical protein
MNGVAFPCGNSGDSILFSKNSEAHEIAKFSSFKLGVLSPEILPLPPMETTAG